MRCCDCAKWSAKSNRFIESIVFIHSFSLIYSSFGWPVAMGRPPRPSLTRTHSGWGLKLDHMHIWLWRDEILKILGRDKKFTLWFDNLMLLKCGPLLSWACSFNRLRIERPLNSVRRNRRSTSTLRFNDGSRCPRIGRSVSRTEYAHTEYLMQAWPVAGPVKSPPAFHLELSNFVLPKLLQPECKDNCSKSCGVSLI